MSTHGVPKPGPPIDGHPQVANDAADVRVVLLRRQYSEALGNRQSRPEHDRQLTGKHGQVSCRKRPTTSRQLDSTTQTRATTNLRYDDLLALQRCRDGLDRVRRPFSADEPSKIRSARYTGMSALSHPLEPGDAVSKGLDRRFSCNFLDCCLTRRNLTKAALAQTEHPFSDRESTVLV